MSKQYNKAIKRKRRESYLKRKKVNAKAKVKSQGQTGSGKSLSFALKQIEAT